MVDSYSKPCDSCTENRLRCCNNKQPPIDHQAVAVKLQQAERSIQLAIEYCNAPEGNDSTDLFIFINCANSYLLEASDKAGKPRRTLY